MKLIVQKAVKDLSIEQTIKTYEEIWLSKTFVLKLYTTQRIEALTSKTTNEEDVKNKLFHLY